MSETTSVNSFEDIDIENLVKGDKDVTDIIDDEIDAEIIDDVSEDEEDKEIKAIDDELDKKEKDKEDEVERAKKRVGKDGHPITENYINEIINNFLSHFKKKITARVKSTNTIAEVDVAWYPHQIKKMPSKNNPLLIIDFRDLVEYRKTVIDTASISTLIYRLTNDPYTVRRLFEENVRKIYSDAFKKQMVEDDDLHTHDIFRKIQVGFNNFQDKPTQLNTLRARFMGKYISCEGVISQYDEKPQVKTIESNWTCDGCKRKYTQNGSKKPSKCLEKDCNSRSFTLNPELSKNVDTINIQLTQQFGGIQKNSTVSRNVRIVGTALVDYVLNNVSPGQIVIINGVTTLAEKFGRESQQTDYNDIEIDAFTVEQKNNVNIFNYDERLLNIVTDYVNDKNINQHVDKLKRSICAHLYGQEHVKFAVLLLLVGTNPRIRMDGTRLKGDINILLIGNSGRGKSDYGTAIQMIVPHSLKAGAKGSTTVAGLTSTVERNPRTGINHISLGLLGLVNLKGVGIIEEANRRDTKDLYDFSTATDDNQQLLVNKGGFHTIIHTKAPIFCTANSLNKRGIWDNTKTVGEQTKLEQFFLSRMDFIIVLHNENSKEYRENLLRHIEKQYDSSILEKEYEAEIEGKSNVKRTEDILRNTEILLRKGDFSGIYPVEYLRHELYHLKTIDCKIVKGSEAYRYIERFWNEFSSSETLAQFTSSEEGGDNDSVASMIESNAGDVRRLYSLLKAAEANGRLHRHKYVTLDDAKEICDLMAVCMASQIPKIGSVSIEDQNEYVKKMMEKNSINKLANSMAREKQIRWKNYYNTFERRFKGLNQALLGAGWETCKYCHGTGREVEMIDRETKEKTSYPCTTCDERGGFDKPFHPNDIAAKVVGQSKLMDDEAFQKYFNLYVHKKFLVPDSKNPANFNLNVDFRSPDIIDSISKIVEMITEKTIAKIEEQEAVDNMNKNKRRTVVSSRPTSFTSAENYTQESL